MSQVANLGARMLLGIKLYEFTTSFRAFKVQMLKRLAFADLTVEGYSFFLTTVVELARRGARMTEVPIHFRERGYGSSKIPPFEIFRGMHNLVRLALIKTMRPTPADRAEAPLLGCVICSCQYAFVPPPWTGSRGTAGCTCSAERIGSRCRDRSASELAQGRTWWPRG
ncbi:hypothetical protein NRY95_01330 [Xanthomonas campestris pv. phormiicola]|nr:hypothetical protein [Xanthomonas campestris pv. phormiicola]UYC16656.1 hypothetical protein NRY95_01330 [Xanthomonas campestris pv. phormiicola]